MYKYVKKQRSYNKSSQSRSFKAPGVDIKVEAVSRPHVRHTFAACPPRHTGNASFLKYQSENPPSDVRIGSAFLLFKEFQWAGEILILVSKLVLNSLALIIYYY